MLVNDLVSVIVPVYNVEKYLNRCVDSIINQIYEHIEIILIDDGSTDESGVICDKYAKKDSRIKVIHKANGGLSSARNAGLDIAVGKWVSFVDSDDYIASDMIYNMITAMSNNDCDIAVTGRVNQYEQGDNIIDFKTDNQIIYDNVQAIEDMLLRKYIDVSVCDKIFVKRLFRNIRFPIAETNEDSAIIFKVFSIAKKVVHTNDSGYFYCHRTGSITTSLSINYLSCVMKHGVQIEKFIEKEHSELLEPAIIFAGNYAAYVYKIITKYKINKKNDFSGCLLRESRAYIIANYKILMKPCYNVFLKRLELFLIRYGLLKVALNVYRTLKFLRGKANK